MFGENVITGKNIEMGCDNERRQENNLKVEYL